MAQTAAVCSVAPGVRVDARRTAFVGSRPAGRAPARSGTSGRKSLRVDALISQPVDASAVNYSRWAPRRGRYLRAGHPIARAAPECLPFPHGRHAASRPQQGCSVALSPSCQPPPQAGPGALVATDAGPPPRPTALFGGELPFAPMGGPARRVAAARCRAPFLGPQASQRKAPARPRPGRPRRERAARVSGFTSAVARPPRLARRGSSGHLLHRSGGAVSRAVRRSPADPPEDLGSLRQPASLRPPRVPHAAPGGAAGGALPARGDARRCADRCAPPPPAGPRPTPSVRLSWAAVPGRASTRSRSFGPSPRCPSGGSTASSTCRCPTASTRASPRSTSSRSSTPCP